MSVMPQQITWQAPTVSSSVVVIAGDWLAEGLMASLPDSHLMGYVAGEVDALVVERGQILALTDQVLAEAKVVFLIDPEDRELWHVEATLAGHTASKIIVLPRFGAISAAEQAMLFILALSRMLFPAYSALVAGNADWTGPANVTEQNHAPEAGLLIAQTLGIIGLGRSGRALAERAIGFGMRIIYYDLIEQSREEVRLGIRRRRFDQLLRESDVVSLHLPFSPESHRLIDAPELAAMKPTALLINVADGRLIDEGALIKALRGGDIAGAGLDAFAYEPLSNDSPLIGFENVVLTPRCAWMSQQSEQARWISLLARQITGGVL